MSVKQQRKKTVKFVFNNIPAPGKNIFSIRAFYLPILILRLHPFRVGVPLGILTDATVGQVFPPIGKRANMGDKKTGLRIFFQAKDLYA